MLKDEIQRIKDLVRRQINRFSDLTDWKAVTEDFNISSYTVFLVIICRSLGWETGQNLFSYAVAHNIIDPEIADCLAGKENLSVLLRASSDCFAIMTEEEVSELYQSYIAQDFELANGVFRFADGKIHRDTLGAYYTSGKFADVIVQSQVCCLSQEGFGRDGKLPKILDSACGSGEFLVAALRCCREMLPCEAKADELTECLYGYDVDPMAVMITRFRLAKESGREYCNAKIRLGNPLLNGKDSNVAKAFRSAMSGRYYAQEMGVVSEGEFDLILGNPPWEKIRFEEKKFLRPFADYDTIKEKNNRQAYIEIHLSQKNRAYLEEMRTDYRMFKKNVRNHPELSLSLVGELNTYALFSELSANLLSERGRCALIVKASLLKMPVCSSLFRHFVHSGILYRADLFTNKNKIFPIDSREEFAVIYFHKCANAEGLQIRFGLDRIEQLEKPAGGCRLTEAFLNKVNPITGMLPNVDKTAQIEFLNRIYGRCPCFSEEFPDCRFARLVHFTNHAAHIKRERIQGYLPVYEGKFIEQYTGKFATFRGKRQEEKYRNKATARLLDDPHGQEYPEERYFIEKEFWRGLSKNMGGRYSVMWRSLTSATNRRTMLATILPTMPASQSVQMLQLDSEEDMLLILALFNSIVFDYIVRLKMAGLDLTQTMIRQIPVPPHALFDREICFSGRTASLKMHIISRIKYMYQDDCRVTDIFSERQTYDINREGAYKETMAELDRLVGYAYALSDQETRQIAAQFTKFYSEKEIGQWF